MNFEIQKREVAYQTRAFDIYRVTARLPNGRVQAFDLVQHNPSITVVPVTAEGKILFVRQYRIGAEATLLELPAGVLEANEESEAGARRELREETGMDAHEFKRLGAAYLAPGYASEFMHFFLARQLFPAPLQQDEDEFLDLVELSIADAFRIARKGEIQDSKTLAALFLVERELEGAAD